MSNSSSSYMPTVDGDALAFFDVPNLTGTPERNLLMAVVERAILDLVGNDEREVEAAREWIFDEDSDSGRYNFSFSWICHQLDLDHEKILEKIRLMPKRGSRRVAPWYMSKGYIAQAS